jgi:predicted membrane protein
MAPRFNTKKWNTLELVNSVAMFAVILLSPKTNKSKPSHDIEIFLRTNIWDKVNKTHYTVVTHLQNCESVDSFMTAAAWALSRFK